MFCDCLPALGAISEGAPTAPHHLPSTGAGVSRGQLLSLSAGRSRYFAFALPAFQAQLHRRTMSHNEIEGRLALITGASGG